MVTLVFSCLCSLLMVIFTLEVHQIRCRPANLGAKLFGLMPVKRTHHFADGNRINTRKKGKYAPYMRLHRFHGLTRTDESSSWSSYMMCLVLVPAPFFVQLCSIDAVDRWKITNAKRGMSTISEEMS
jgi:hypothetical protein